MNRTTDLESRLMDWAKEYGGGRYENHGWHGISPLAQLMKYHGRPPDGLNPARVVTDAAADEVNKAVVMLEAQKGGDAPAAVLRCEYFSGDVARDVRLQRLRQIGHRMETTRYSHHLRIAKIHVAAWLHISFSDHLDVADSIAMLEHEIAERA
ncbi:MAG: hypothetical protein ABW154_14175 [Dyella sp.]